jgi:LacI family repressor for deo operon, udp, cdd, tsx, nupC, and nupG
VDSGKTGQMQRPPTIRDVATVAGVAESTVSRAMTNPDRVHHVTRARILRIAAEMNYVPSAQARAMSGGRTNSVGLMVADVTNPFHFGIIRGTQSQLRSAGLTQLLVDTEESRSIEASTLSRLRNSVDGVILASSRLTEDELSAAAQQLPLVTINRQVDTVASVIIDSATGVSQALEHLVSLGHQRVSFISGPDASWSNQIRWNAAAAAAERLGVKLSRVGPFVPQIASGGAAADAVVNDGATACIAFNDLLAIGVMHRFAERGMKVPDDMSVLGCDDIFGADFCDPPLTTIAANSEAAGRAAISLLLERIAQPNTPISYTLIPTHLTIRASTGRAPVASR